MYSLNRKLFSMYYFVKFPDLVGWELDLKHTIIKVIPQTKTSMSVCLYQRHTRTHVHRV